MAKYFLMFRLPRFAEITLCLALGAALSIAAGQDASWDLRNYHLYNAFAFLNGRMYLDFFPADKHSGLNPLLDLIYSTLALGPLSHFPRVLAALMGFWYGLLVFITLQITRLLFAPCSTLEQRILVPLTTLTAVTGAMALSQIGTSSNDIAVAMLALLGLLAVLRATAKAQTPWHPFALSGLIFGMASGAKLTIAVFAPALVLTLLLILPWRQSLRASVLFCAAWLGGFLLTFGWWGWMMWQRFANPVFPMLNGIFKSPLAPPLNLNDVRFLPRTIWQWLAYPLFWAWDQTNHLVYEFDFCDPRMAIAYIAIVFFAALTLQNFFLRRNSETHQISLTHPQKITLFFLVFSYIAWLFTTSILRYAIALEVLSMPVAILLITRMIGSVRIKIGVALLACTLCLTTARHSDWGHRAFSDKVIDADMSWVQPNTLFLGLYEPIAYLAAAVPPSLHAQFAGLGFISYLQGWPLGKTGEQVVRNHQGPIIILFREERRPFLRLLIPLGLSPEVKNCRTIRSNLAPLDNQPMLACEASRS